MQMDFIIDSALVLAGFGIWMVLRRQANIRFSLNPDESRNTRGAGGIEWRRHLVQITLHDAPAIVYGLCQASVGAVLVLINAPVLLDSAAEADSAPYTKFVVYLLLGMCLAIAWQVIRSVRKTVASDEIQSRIAKTGWEGFLGSPEFERRKS